MSILYYYFEALKKTIDFKGIASRKAFWSFMLIHIMVAEILGFTFSEKIVQIYAYIMILPLVSLTTRRLHDTGTSGWLQLIVIIPFGQVALIIWLMYGSEIINNRYLQRTSDVLQEQ